MSRAKTVMTSFAPGPRRLLNERTSPVTHSRSVPAGGSADSSRSRTTTFTRSIVPESRWVSSGKVKKRSCRFSCDSAGGAASVPQSSA